MTSTVFTLCTNVLEFVINNIVVDFHKASENPLKVDFAVKM